MNPLRVGDDLSPYDMWEVSSFDERSEIDDYEYIVEKLRRASRIFREHEENESSLLNRALHENELPRDDDASIPAPNHPDSAENNSLEGDETQDLESFLALI